MKLLWFVALLAFIIITSVPVKGAVIECADCADCTGKIASAADGDIIQLNSSLSDVSGTCISFGGKDNLTFDCLSHAIGGNGSGGYGIWLNDSDGGSNNNSVRNCLVSGFYHGILLAYSSNNTLGNITSQENSERGVQFFGASQYNTLRNSRISGNGNRGAYMEASGTDYPSQNILYDNMFNNSFNFGSNHDNNVNYLNTSNSTGPNIVGGPYTGGNFWATPSGSGFSQTCLDSDSNGMCDSVYQADPSNIDYLPLKIIVPDTTPPSISFVSPTPANNTNASGSYMEMNASLSEAPGACLLGWYNGSWQNLSMAIQGSCYRNMTGLANGVYQFMVHARDSAGNWNSTEIRQAGISFPAQPPQASLMVAYSISPKSVKLSQSTLLSVNATSNGSMDRIILTITLPNSSSETFGFTGNATLNYTPPLAGLYNLTVFANTTQGSNLTMGDNFTAASAVLFNSTVITYNGTEIPSKLELYYPGTGIKLSEFQSAGSYLNQEALGQSYDLLFKAYQDRLQVTLKNVNMTGNLNRTIGFDDPVVQGYALAYAVSNAYGMSSASLIIIYTGLGIDEDYMGLYKCDGWNFPARACNGTWNLTNCTQDKANNYITFEVSSFSAFSLKQEPFCGDYICQASESADNCSADCDCTDGENMTCGTAMGECTLGNATCHDGIWSDCVGAVGPVNETCDGLDNDCDGTADEGLTQQCGTDIGACDFGIQACANGAWGSCIGGAGPGTEACNGIDDDCDGSTDEGGDCCASGDNRPCGTTLDMGECHPGTSVCANSVWGQCAGFITPVTETCGNGKDDDCDGTPDELEAGCADCANSIQDGNETGVDCGGFCPACVDYTPVWISISMVGAVIFGALLILYFRLRKQGRELSWEELFKRWTPASE